jgi:hypothetical protein
MRLNWIAAAAFRRGLIVIFPTTIHAPSQRTRMRSCASARATRSLPKRGTSADTTKRESGLCGILMCNPKPAIRLTGRFYIEAERGDALEVHLDRVRLNRNWGYTSYRLSPDILTAAAAERQYKNFHKMDVLRPWQADLIPWDID